MGDHRGEPRAGATGWRRRGSTRLDQFRTNTGASGREDDRELGLALAYFEAGRLEDARGLLDGLVAAPNTTGSMGLFAALGAIAAREGKRAEALRFDSLLQASPERYMLGSNTYQRARIHASLGERETTVDLLQSAIQQGIEFSSLHADLAFASLHDYGPFQELLKPRG